MGGSDQRKGKEPALFDDKFPEGMRILVVDDNPVCLKVLEVFLRCCKYKRELKSPSPPFPQYIIINVHVIFYFYVYSNDGDGCKDGLEYVEGWRGGAV
jgi:hypothetical protein